MHSGSNDINLDKTDVEAKNIRRSMGRRTTFNSKDKSNESNISANSDIYISELDASDMETSNEMTMDIVDLETGLKGKEFADTFMEFLKIELSDENLEFYMEIQNFKKLLMPKEIQQESERIFKLFIDDNCAKQINIDSSARKAVNKLMNYPNSNMFDACEEQVLTLMKSDCYPRFLQSDLYKKSTKNLPSFSKRNKLLIPLVLNDSQITINKRDSQSSKSSSNVNIPQGEGRMSITNSSNMEIYSQTKMIVLPKFDESIVDQKTTVKQNNLRVIFHNRNYILTPKDGQTLRDLLSFLNISNKELTSYYAFLIPCQKIIDITQNPIYYLKKTIEIRRFALLSLCLGQINHSLKCAFEYPVSFAIDSFLAAKKVSSSDVDSVKLKNKKPFFPGNNCGKYDRNTIVLTLKNETAQ